MTKPNEPKYSMRMELSVLEHLGVNLYSTVPAVISETVANAWDADARQVTIEMRESDGERVIIVTDDGCGMDEGEINRKFLLVGYRKREREGDKTPGGRVPMGRKGIGKLSLFSIADRIEVHTRKDGGEGNALLLDREAIREQIEQSDGVGEYHPEELPFDKDSLPEGGTRLIIRGLRKRVTVMTSAALRKRLARRFGIRCIEEMAIRIGEGADAERITLADRDYSGKFEYLFRYDLPEAAPPQGGKMFDRGCSFGQDGREAPGGTFRIRGWIGTVYDSKTLKEDKGSLNKISIMMREKVALEDILPAFDFTSVYTRFLVGEIYADFLDDGSEDIATSNRQGIVEHDPRYEALREFLRGEVRHIGSEWNRLKMEEGEKKLLKAYPKLEEWLDSLGPSERKQARQYFGRINRISAPDKKRMFAIGVEAFESHRLAGALGKLKDVSEGNLAEFLELAKEYDDLEASLYYSITRGRLTIIKKLQDAVREDVLERVLQEYLYHHLWLLDPSWERGTQLPSMEQRVTVAFKKIDDRLTPEQKREMGRVDIQYCKTPGIHVIVELKRASVSVTDGSLVDQTNKYRRALESCLDEEGRKERVEVVCVLGKLPVGWEGDPKEEARGRSSLSGYSIRVKTYKDLIDGAYRAYNEYLAKQSKISRLQEIIGEVRDRGATEADGG